MSSFLYPNSATRKLYGQAGKALARQNKRFQSVQQRLSEEARMKELGVIKRASEQLQEERAKFRSLIKKIIVGAIIALVSLLTIIFW